MLEVSEIGLCMDAGHFLVGGGDPVEYVKKWGDRIDHVHIKTADLPRFQQVVDEGLPTNAIWEREVFPKLGEGALDVDAFLAALREIDYAGWLVVEQDIFPTTAERFSTGSCRPAGESRIPAGAWPVSAPFRLGLIGGGRMRSYPPAGLGRFGGGRDRRCHRAVRKCSFAT
jgi:hypothetical protein